MCHWIQNGRQLTYERTRVCSYLDCKNLETQVRGEFVSLRETLYIKRNIYCSFKVMRMRLLLTFCI